jgi:hypothetical protein
MKPFVENCLRQHAQNGMPCTRPPRHTGFCGNKYCPCGFGLKEQNGMCRGCNRQTSLKTTRKRRARLAALIVKVEEGNIHEEAETKSEGSQTSVNPSPR